MTSTDTVVIRKSDDVLRLIDSGRITPKHPGMIKVVALGSIFVDGWDLTSFGLGTVQMSEEFGLSNSGWSTHSLPFIAASALVGAMIGGLSGGIITDRIGRTKMLFLTLFLLVFATVMCATAPNPEWFIFWRFLMGLGIGLDVPVALAMLAEYSAISQKGRNVTLAQLMSTGATAIAFFTVIPLHYMNIGTELWRWAIGLGAVPAVIVLVLRFIYSAESPMWAAKYEGLESAAKILREKYGLTVKVEAEQETHEQQRSVMQSLAMLFRDPYTRRTVLVSVLVVCQAAQYFAINLYIPKILNQLMPGNIVMVLVLSGLINVIGALGAIGCITGVQKLGLRKLGFVGFSITASCLLVISFAFNHLSGPLAAALIAVFAAAHNFGAGYVGTAMGTLSYPTSIRGIAGGYTQTITRVGGIIGAVAFPMLLAATNTKTTIGLIAIAPIIAVVTLSLIKWDPVGKDVEEHGSTAAAALPAH